jgi:predicted RNA-binding protein with PUA-like domain
MANSRLLARGNRLSVMPLTDEEFNAIVAAGRKRKRPRATPKPI